MNIAAEISRGSKVFSGIKTAMQFREISFMLVNWIEHLAISWELPPPSSLRTLSLCPALEDVTIMLSNARYQ